jgi:hypothetical protein
MSINGLLRRQLKGWRRWASKVGSTRGVVRVGKYGCDAEFRKGTDGLYQMTVMPTIMVKGQFTRLWDAGYQRFLLTDDGQKIPALASHLENLRKFNEELRTALGVPTFYNEALRVDEPNLGVRPREGAVTARCRTIYGGRAQGCRLLRTQGLSPGSSSRSSRGAPEIQPQSLGHPSLWRGRFEPIRLIHVGWEATKALVDAVVFFLDFPSYRTYQELAFRVCDHHGFAE